MNNRSTLDAIGVIATVIGVCLELLMYFGVKSNQVTDILRNHVYVVYGLAALLIIWGLVRIFRRIWRRSGHLSRSERTRLNEELRNSFAKCPYWIKVFLKTVLDKETAYSDAYNFQFENYSQFLLQFVDYKTVNDNVWQYSMRSEAKAYLQSHADLLGDVTDKEVRQHARKSSEAYLAHMADGFYWWYYSDDDFIEPIPLDSPGVQSLFR